MASITSRGDGVWEVAVGGGSNRTSKRVHGAYADALAVAASMEASRGGLLALRASSLCDTPSVFR